MKLFKNFESKKIRVTGATINLVTRGRGPAVLLLHGYPETHVMWHRVAPALARDYTVVCADLRGYGDSSKPKGLPDHSNYSKRAMAQDMAEVMTSLGHRKFHLVGHDRGGRVAHRLARDYGSGVHSRVMSLTVLDISPTLRVFENTDMALARAFYHWFFLIQSAPMPERMIGSMARDYLLGRIGRGPGGLRHFPKAVQREYLRCFDARGIHGSCEDYRAAATIDLVHDRKSLKQKLRMPVLALWARHSPVGTMFDCLANWREVAQDVRGRALDCGHFLPEEKPREVLRELRHFLARV
ncbi:MAG TPA: alpha/beta hydrolase [Burkholderiales bacterium]|nr:alpha/beta hydrolase [Burkholderiales bacterium]